MTLFPKQFEAFSFQTRFGAAIAGVQSGKTYAGSYWSAKKMAQFPDKNGIIVAPTYKILHSATLKKLFELLPELQPYYREQRGEIILPTGGTIFCRSADNPLGIEGITAHWVWLDEGGLCSELTWTVLRSRVSITGGQIFITTTPYNMGWLYQQFFIPWRDKTDLSLSFFSWSHLDNPLADKTYFESERSRLPPEEFARRYMGEFRKMTGLVWDVPNDQIIPRPEGIVKKAETRIIGVDWGFRNPAAIVVCALYDQQWYVLDEWKQAERTTEEIRQVLKNFIKEYQVSRVYADPAEPDRIEECRQDGIPMYEAMKDVLGGISYVKQLIYEKKLYLTNGCPELIDELSMYHYAEPKPGDTMEKEAPVKENDHLADALRYCLYSVKPVRAEKMIATPAVPGFYPELGL